MGRGSLIWRLATVAARRVDGELARYRPVLEHLRQVVPEDLERLDPDDYRPPARILGRGVDLREREQLELLHAWRGRFAELFGVLRSDPAINTAGDGGYRLHNGQYPTPDAEVYAAMICDRQPRRIVEVGAGYSTRIARRAIEYGSPGSELIVVDPEPRASVAQLVDRIHRTRVETLDPAVLGIDEQTLLFIDSSHVTRAGGDVPLLFCSLLPELAPGVLVHVHDVFLPYDYPAAYRRRLYTEAYVLWTLLARGSRCRVRLATYYMTMHHLEAMREVFGPAVGSDQRYVGASFWFELT
jgi:hypothetical protein